MAALRFNKYNVNVRENRKGQSIFKSQEGSTCTWSGRKSKGGLHFDHKITLNFTSIY
jgi:hypothetical protein